MERYGKLYTGIQWYAFSDINKNGKPELIVKYGGVETDCSIWVYEYKGGKYKKAKGAIYDTWHPTLHNYTSGNGLVLQERPISEYDCEIVTLVTLSKGRIKGKTVRERYLSSENRERLCRVRLKHIHHKEKARKNNETNKTNHHDPYPVNRSSIFMNSANLPQEMYRQLPHLP